MVPRICPFFHIELGIYKELWPETIGNCLKFQLEAKYTKVSPLP